MYLIESIESKDESRPNMWHSKCIGKRCVVECLWVGCGVRLWIEGFLGDFDKWSSFRTSKMLAAKEQDEYLYIETLNSVYVLRRLPDET